MRRLTDTWLIDRWVLMENEGEGFVTVRFSGKRFEGGNLPVSLLDNIKSYQEILLLLAEEVWREQNPDRKKLPKHFKKNMSLSFSRVQDGSAKAVLRSDPSISDGFLSDEYATDYLRLAQSRFLKVAAAANENRRIEGVPQAAGAHLKRLISGLGDQEQLEVISHSSFDRRRNRARFSDRTCKALIESARDESVIKVSGLGIVQSILDGSEEIELLSAHGRFKYPVSRGEIRSGQFPIASFLEFSIDARLNHSGHVSSVEASHGINKVEENSEHLRLSDRLQHIEGLVEGWKNGAGSPPSKRALQWARDLSGFICSVYKKISAFPELDGSINIEFSVRDIEVLVMCCEDYIRIEAFDETDADPVECVYFGISPKLLKDLIDVREFIS